MKMYLYDFLKMFDGANLNAAVYINDEEEPVYTGDLFGLPWWLVDLELNYKTEDRYPISYRQNFGDEYDNKPGVVIFLKEG